MLVIKVRNVTHFQKIKACNQAKYYTYIGKSTVLESN